jgi:hypothetical protein
MRVSELPLDPTKNVQAGTLMVAYEYKPVVKRIRDENHGLVLDRVVRRRRIGRGWLMKFAQPLVVKKTPPPPFPAVGIQSLPAGTKDIRAIGELTLLETIGRLETPSNSDVVSQIFDISTALRWRLDKFQYFKLQIVFSDRIDWRIQIALEDAFGKEVAESPQVEQVIKKLEEINVALNK